MVLQYDLDPYQRLQTLRVPENCDSLTVAMEGDQPTLYLFADDPEASLEERRFAVVTTRQPADELDPRRAFYMGHFVYADVTYHVFELEG